MATKKAATSNVSIRQAAALARGGKPVPRDKRLSKAISIAKGKGLNPSEGKSKGSPKISESSMALGVLAKTAAQQFLKYGAKPAAKSSGARWSSSSGLTRSASSPAVKSAASATRTAASEAKARATAAKDASAAKPAPKPKTRAERKGPGLTAAQKKAGAYGAGGIAAASALTAGIKAKQGGNKGRGHKWGK